MAAKKKAKRSVLEIQKGIDEFENQFARSGRGTVPPGTPNRKQLQRDADAAAQKKACLPRHKEKRRALWAERKSAMRSENAKLAAQRRALDPVASLTFWTRQRVFRALRNLGFKRESTSGQSAYYRRHSILVRVSDHAVPMTAEREWNLANGGRSWADSTLSFVVGQDDEEAWLDDVGAMVLEDE